MSLLQSEAIYTAIESACVTAWNVQQVYFGTPQTPNPIYPYGVIRLDTVPMASTGMITTEQTYSFVCVYVNTWNTTDTTWNIETAKQDAANLLITQLMTGTTFARIAYKPQITEVNFVEIDDPRMPTYEVYVTFSCQTTVLSLVS